VSLRGVRRPGLAEPSCTAIVDDLDATVERLPSMEAGFVTAAVVDPFGNILGS